jgi:hypothetical protein
MRRWTQTRRQRPRYRGAERHTQTRTVCGSEGAGECVCGRSDIVCEYVGMMWVYSMGHTHTHTHLLGEYAQYGGCSRVLYPSEAVSSREQAPVQDHTIGRGGIGGLGGIGIGGIGGIGEKKDENEDRGMMKRRYKAVKGDD